MNTSIEEKEVRSICKDCANRFRRVFIPSNMSRFLDANTDLEDPEDDNDLDTITDGEDVVIMTLCLASDMDLDLDATIECTHFVNKNDSNLFRHR